MQTDQKIIMNRYLKTIELNKILDMLAACAGNEESKRMIRSLAPSSDTDEVRSQMSRTAAAFDLSVKNGSAPSYNYKDVRPMLTRARSGASLTTGELLSMALMLRQIGALHDYRTEAEKINVLQRHMSAVMLVGMIGVGMMFVSGMPSKTFWKFIAFVVVVAVIVLAAKLFIGGSGFSYISERIESWKNPEGDPQGKTWQTYQSLLAIGSGGWTGLGFGESRQKFLYLPMSQNDFVFSIVCEELGFVGAMVVVLLFAMFVGRGFYIATHAKDRFGMLVAAGISMHIGAQAFLNIMVACNAFPNTGISLPFFSYGGTSLLIQLVEVGILLNISRQAHLKK